MAIRPVFLATAIAGLLTGAGWLALAPGEGGSASAAAPAPAPEPALKMMVAARPLAEGEILRPSDFRSMPVTGDLPAGAAAEGSPEAAKLAGSVLRAPVAEGAPVLAAQIVLPGDRSFLAAVIKPGRRAVAVPVDAVSSAGGLIWPGDHVDVILAHELRQDGVPLTQSVLAQTVLRDVRVLSIDQRLDAAPPSTGAPEEAAAAVSRPSVPATVTLEVTPAEAEQVEVALTLGKLSLTLRSLAAVPDAPPGEGTFAGTVMPALARVAVRAPASLSAAPVSPTAPTTAAPAAAPAVARGVRVFRGSGEAQ